MYHLERTVAIASGCPLAISDEHINTQLPHDISVLGTGLERQNHRANQFLGHIQLSQIQSEIHGVQFFDQTLPKDTPSYTDWMRKMENSIQTWQDCLATEGDMPGWSAIAADHCRLLLYRPCSRNMIPDQSCLQAACTVAIRTINSHWTIARAGTLIFSLSSVFNAFQAGMVLLYALGNHGPAELGSVLGSGAREALGLLPSLFVSLSVNFIRSQLLQPRLTRTECSVSQVAGCHGYWTLCQRAQGHCSSEYRFGGGSGIISLRYQSPRRA